MDLTVKSVKDIGEGYFVIALDAPGLEYPSASLFCLGEPRGMGASRLYSTISPRNSSSLEFLIHDRGSISHFLCSRNPGDQIGVKFSGRMFQPEPWGIWIANGTGVAPFLSLLREWQEENDTGQPKEFFLGMPKWSEICQEIQERFPLTNFYISRENPPAGCYKGRLILHMGMIPIDKENRYFLCGSGDRITQVSGHLISRGISWRAIDSEAFG